MMFYVYDVCGVFFVYYDVMFLCWGESYCDVIII